ADNRRPTLRRDRSPYLQGHHVDHCQECSTEQHRRQRI
ncbi:MAG: hypothetical protein AVDCRST_MAG93-9705, partial [uncultured Chloroflexia bacterium]